MMLMSKDHEGGERKDVTDAIWKKESRHALFASSAFASAGSLKRRGRRKGTEEITCRACFPLSENRLGLRGGKPGKNGARPR